MVTEGGAHVVINLEPVWHVDVETFFLKLGVQGGGESQVKAHVSAPVSSSPPNPPLPNRLHGKMSKRGSMGTGASGGSRGQARGRKDEENWGG